MPDLSLNSPERSVLKGSRDGYFRPTRWNAAAWTIRLIVLDISHRSPAQQWLQFATNSFASARNFLDKSRLLCRMRHSPSRMAMEFQPFTPSTTSKCHAPLQSRKSTHRSGYEKWSRRLMSGGGNKANPKKVLAKKPLGRTRPTDEDAK